MSNIDADDVDTQPNVDANESTSGSDTNNQAKDLTNLRENFNQQQAKISALKELVRKSEVDHGKNTASAQEKVRNIAQRLTHLKSKASRSRQSEKSISEIQEEINFESNTAWKEQENESLQNSLEYSLPTAPILPPRARSETPGSEKIQLLRQQMEQNRLKMAERETSKRGIEQLVTQLKAKFDSSQLSLDRAHQLGSSVGDLSAFSGYAPLKHQSTGDLHATFSLDRERIKYLEKRVRHLESEIKQKEMDYLNKDPESQHLKAVKHLQEKVLDLEENLKEKDGVIEARTQAASLITESLSLKGKDTVDLLEETKKEMFKMQTNFVAAEAEMNVRISKLEKEIEIKDRKIANLEEVNDILETARFDLTLKNSELDSKTGSVEDYVNKLNELNKINEALQHRIERLENEKDGLTEVAIELEHARRIDELEAKISALQSENDDLKKSLQSALNAPANDTSDQERINNLEATIAAQKDECLNLTNLLQNVQDQLTEKTVEYNVLMANFNVLEEKVKSYAPKSLFSKSTDEEAQAEINKLSKQLDDANKTMIKTKLKMKQLQKQIDTFKKASDSNKEIVKQAEEIQRLSDKIKELETENLVLKSHNLQSNPNDGRDDLDKNAAPTELQAKIKLLETTCQNQTSAIQLLEEQKLDMTADLNSTKTELSSLRGHIKDIDKQEVTTQMDSIVLEEKVEDSLREIDALKLKIEKLFAENGELKTKLDRYASENMELLEKIDKLSKGSSVESMEILERLTQEEKLEMERFQQVVEEERQRYRQGSISQDVDITVSETGSNHDRSDDAASASRNVDRLAKSCEDSVSEKTERIAIEHNELIAKMKILQEENVQFIKLIEDLRAEKVAILEKCDELKAKNVLVSNQLKEIDEDRQNLLETVNSIHNLKNKLENEIADLNMERDSVVATSKQNQPEKLYHFADQETYKAKVKSLNAELDNYRSAKDKNAKVNASKKLAKEAKAITELMDKLIANYDCSMEQYVTLQAEVEGERLARELHDKNKLELMARECVGGADETIKELQEELVRLKNDDAERKLQCDELTQQIEQKEVFNVELKRSLDELKEKSNEMESNKKTEYDRLNERIRELEIELNQTKEYNFQELHKQRKEFDNLIETNKKEVDILRDLVEEQKQQLIAAYTEHENEQQEKEKQLALYDEQIKKLQADLNDANDRMSRANDKYAIELTEKLDSMQTLLDENQKLLNVRTEELAHKQPTIDTLNQQLMDFYATMEQHSMQLNEKDEEIERMQSLVDRNKAELKKMNQSCLAAERRIKEAESVVKQNETEWEKARTALENKNKEQLDKLKKFAANLKKRNAQYAELEQKYAALEKSAESPVERVIVQDVGVVQNIETDALQQSRAADSELNSLKETITNLEHQINGYKTEVENLRYEVTHRTSELENLRLRLSEKTNFLDEVTVTLESKNTEIHELREKLGGLQSIKEELNRTVDDLKAKNIKIEKCKAIIKEKNKEIKRLQELTRVVNDRESNESSVNELKLELDQLQSEKEKIDIEFANYRTYIEAKLQNNELIVESIETENSQLKERIGRLEENIGIAERRRLSLERHSELLGLQLQEKQTQIEHVEDEYTDRLKALVGQDEIIEQKLKDLEDYRDSLLETVKELTHQVNELQLKNDILQKSLSELECTKLIELEAENKDLSQKIEKLEADLSRQQQEFDQTLAAKHSELLDLENELSNHLRKVETERRSIQENLEKSRDENTTLQDEIVRLRDTQTDLEQSKNDLEKEITWVKLQNDTMTVDQSEAHELRMQVVHDQTEVENLHAQNIEMIDRHAREVNALQAQLYEANNLCSVAQNDVEKLRLEINSIRNDHINELDTLRAQICQDQTEIVNLRFRNDQMTSDHETEYNSLQQRIAELSTLQDQANHDHNEIENLRLHKQQLENQISVLRQQITELDALQMNVGQNLTQDQMEVQQLRAQISHDQTEIESLRHQVQQLHSSHEIELGALRQQIAELDSLRMQVGQNQTDDQVFIQNENERLQALLAEKEIEIQNYQRQNLQLQMSSVAGQSSLPVANDPFSTFSTNTTNANELTAKLADLENQLENALHDANSLQEKCADLQRLCSEKDAEILRLQDRNHNILSTSGESSALESIIAAHQTHPLNAFDFGANLIESSRSPTNSLTEVQTVSFEDHGQQIEDLQRNVSDLEKYVTDLEHKLKAATEENAKHNLDRFNLENMWATKSKQYEEQIALLNGEIDSLRGKFSSIEAEKLIFQSQSQSQVVVDSSKQREISPLPSAASLFLAPTIFSNPFDEIGSASQQTDDTSEQHGVPVVEDIIVQKKTYLCYPSEEQNLSPISANANDGWGESSWGNDAMLEEEHQRQTIPLEQNEQSNVFNRAAINLQLEIDELKAERETVNSELTALQVKYQKLLKKLREYKTKNDQYEHSKARSAVIETNDLDLAIQDELNNQVKSLEQRVKELKIDLEKENQEKKKLLSRIDVLTAANDRMVEMKDKQDVEIEVCQTKIRELNGKLEKLSQWGDENQINRSDEQLSVRLAEAVSQNRLLEERISRLQDSIADRDDGEDEREQLNEQLRTLMMEKTHWEESISAKDIEIKKLTARLATLEGQNIDFRATIDVLTVESNNIKMYLDRLKADHKQKIDENNNLSEQLMQLDERNTDLAKQVEEMRQYNLNAQDIEQRIQDLNASIQYKDSEIAALNDRIDADNHTMNSERQELKNEIARNNETISKQREEIVRLTSEMENITKQQQQQQQQQQQLPVVEPGAPSVTQDLRKLEMVVNDLREEKAQMEAELQVLNDQVLKNLEIEDQVKRTALELDMKNIEIRELKNSLQQLKMCNQQPTQVQLHEEVLNNKLQEKDVIHQSAIDLLNAQWQQIADQKCSELADSWRHHLQTREDEFAKIENDLRKQLDRLEQQKQSDKSVKIEEHLQSPTSNEMNTEKEKEEIEHLAKNETNTDQAELIKTMQSALESQEMEIVSLKEQLAIRSAEYARIAASVDPYGMRSTSSNMHSISSTDRHVGGSDESAQKGNELDLALYMLHQRDMRCEELTQEVIHLLEERDTLQLKLSNSIRRLEESKLRAGVEATESLDASANNSPSKSGADTINDSIQSLDVSTKEQTQSDNLNLKLSELHNVSHSRDKTLYEERDQRRRQMTLLQRDVANMPPEALAELFGRDYNPNSRNTHDSNPSSMLLNWLWDKMAPSESDN